MPNLKDKLTKELLKYKKNIKVNDEIINLTDYNYAVVEASRSDLNCCQNKIRCK